MISIRLSLVMPMMDRVTCSVIGLVSTHLTDGQFHHCGEIGNPLFSNNIRSLEMLFEITCSVALAFLKTIFLLVI